MSSIETVILSQLVSNEQYLRNVSPHLKSEYFEDKLERKIHEIIMDFFSKYNKSPTKRIIELAVREQKSLNQTDYDSIIATIHGLDDEANEDYDWLMNSTEKFCKDRSIYLALVQAINIAEGNDKELKPDAIPDILSKALAVSFDTTVGHDYFGNHDDRYDYYHAVESRIPFSLDILNQVTNGGMPKKTLNLFVAGCVTPDTKVYVRMWTNVYGRNAYADQLVEIKDLQEKIKNKITFDKIEVLSPDGWVEVTNYVEKGKYIPYTFTLENGMYVTCNEVHLFETRLGWLDAKKLWIFNQVFKIELLTEFGWSYIKSIEVGKEEVDIVDITVDHPNHRYYTNGISSHNTGVGKSLTMCDHSAYLIKQGYKVLYVTMEMAEERIAERIDCNLFDMEIKNLFKMDKDSYNSKISNLKERYKGNLVIKEYPTGQANVGHFRVLLDELKLKRNFIPDVVFIDYLSICSSQRLKGGGNVNSYTYIKAISEELRGLAVEHDVALVSAVQFNRDGNKNSDSELTDISESFGIAMTADFMVGMIRTEELDELKQIMFKQLKSRYGDVNYYKRFVVGVELSKFKLHDVEGFSNDTPMFDKSQQIKQDRADIDFDG